MSKAHDLLKAEVIDLRYRIAAAEAERDRLQARVEELEGVLNAARRDLSEFANMLSREDSFPEIDAALQRETSDGN